MKRLQQTVDMIDPGQAKVSIPRRQDNKDSDLPVIPSIFIYMPVLTPSKFSTVHILQRSGSRPVGTRQGTGTGHGGISYSTLAECTDNYV
jgi:hypothetical protein